MTLLFIKKVICCNILEVQVVYFDFMAYHDYIITLTMAHFYLSGTVVRSKNNFSSFLLLIRAKQLYPDLKSDPRYDTPRKVAYERKALEFPGTLLGTYFSAEARDTQHALNQMQAVGKVEGTYSR